ncbi:MAG TPA: hypothetical protein V6D11_18500 [Waterburya sp.]
MQRSPFIKAGIVELVRVAHRSHVGFPHVNPTYSDERSHFGGRLSTEQYKYIN